MPDTAAGMRQPVLYRYSMILLGEDLVNVSLKGLMRGVESDPMTCGLPVVIIAGKDPAPEMFVEWNRLGISLVISDSGGPSGIAEACVCLDERRMNCRLDPVTGLISGPALMKTLDRLCSDANHEWYFIEVRIRGLKAYSLYYGYDEGDELLAGIAGMLKQTVEEYGNDNDFAGRIGGSRLCIVTESRSVDTICRSMLSRAPRIISKYYSTFEWMKGYITIEDGKEAGNYFLCEAIAGALLIPAAWDSNVYYLLDIADQMIKNVMKSGKGYIVAKP